MKVVLKSLEKKTITLSCGTENEEVHQDWILNLSTSISFLHNESIGLTSAGSPCIRYIVNDMNECSTKIP